MHARRAAAFWVLFAGISAVSAVLVLNRPAWDRLSDLDIYRGAVQTVQAGQPLYEYAAANGGPFTYPPFAILVLWPVGVLPESLLYLIWLVLTCCAVAAIAAATAGVITAGRRHHHTIVAVMACGLMLSAPAQSNLRFGQVSVFIVLLALVDAVGLTPPRFRGVLIGVAAAVKLTPLLFVAFLLISGRWRDAARAVGAFVAAGSLAALVLPAESWTYWTDAMFTTSRIGNLASLGNQSLHGMLLRIGVDGAALPYLWAGLVAMICSVGLIRARSLHLGGRPAHAAVMVGCATVAASPVSWTHHQIWPVLAAMLLIGAPSVLKRAMGGVLLLTMVASLGVVLRDISTTPGLQFLLENARAFGALAVTLAGFGGMVLVGAAAMRAWRRVAVTAAAVLATFAVMPLPAAADPSFKAYTLADADNPRYFFACRARYECAGLTPRLVTFGFTREPTKVRISGVVDASVARLEYRSSAGGPPRLIPLVQRHPGQLSFAFRCAHLINGRLLAYAADGSLLATFSDDELMARTELA